MSEVAVPKVTHFRNLRRGVMPAPRSFPCGLSVSEFNASIYILQGKRRKTSQNSVIHSEVMPRPLHKKSTVEEIRKRFDADVERFSKLETGQQAAMDAPVILDVVARSAACHIRPHETLLDIAC